MSRKLMIHLNTLKRKLTYMVSYPKTIMRRYKQKRYVLSDTNQLIFLRRLHRLLLNGYPMIAALNALTFDEKFKWTVDTIVYHLKRGQSIDIACGHAKFNDIIIAFLYFVRINGQLNDNIKNSITILEQRIAYKEKFMNVLRYPIVLFIFFLILLFFIKLSIIPSFEQLFQTHIKSSTAVLLSMYTIDILITIFIVCLCLTAIL